ncbi:hypothetical protein DPMN_171712 [Dreissena polymorpha]|uniref:Uncharacterized protein n=1 Tax=Dreissena polymorpha TaxID=45954 RepID=A0A9D4E0X8_DREPO|nr:hypothetical protein DPMN_171712 [Dreissena polymorpha]
MWVVVSHGRRQVVNALLAFGSNLLTPMDLHPAGIQIKVPKTPQKPYPGFFMLSLESSSGPTSVWPDTRQRRSCRP